ncbi:hypothetical protein KZO01_25310 [Kurthia zopfii]|uniref:Uncharacterized protein n=1 Tax=Kurthia zopfii TaxID=1650 RepID=A0A8B4QET4_9BACL|nr:hypothetical protein [Kurthia zopfii]TDR32865.1 hypothetical protein DFR61_1608 [Kurthia zopfii]GEK32222.1 hypothetical protein KZO01_25310 [Kurthia zopfii]STX11217.1 Uncharacterised protein [Kurthia zopfii]VEI05429.1 Uncharacterised protein [Kurthia zopfii]
MAKLSLENIELMLGDAKEMLEVLEAPGEVDAGTKELIQLTKEQIEELEEMKKEREAE